MTLGLTPRRGAPKREPPRPPLATAGMPAMVPGVPVDPPPGAPAQLCDARVTGVLAAGIPAPPAQLGGTDSWPIDVPPPAAASTGAAPAPPRPPAAPTAPAGPTSDAKAVPRPPKSADAVEGPASAVIRPPPPIPIKSDSAEVKLPTSSSGTWIRLLDKPPATPVVSKVVRLEMRPVMVVGAALDAAPDAPLDALDSEDAAAPAWLAASGSE